jgi:EAL domain-containing protein (putative c-di-GMP-specific phosphodiesterase class I)
MPLAVALGFYRMEGARVSGAIALSNANVALNQAKQNMHTNFEFFSRESAHVTRQRLTIISDLRHAFEKRELTVWYQPQIDLKTNKVSGVEALLRWPNGIGGFVQPPSTFVPLAEHSGLIVDIGYWVIEQCCALFQSLRGTPNAPPRFAANVSMVQFRSADFAKRLIAVLCRWGIRCDELELEITENLAMDDPQRVFTTLKELRGMGVTISVDDFGTGFSSLSLLNHLPIDRLKIDRSFVCEIGQREGRELADTIVSIGRKLELVTIAEGIETPKQLSYLRTIGCDVGQGFLLARPMPPNELKQWLQRRLAGPPTNEVGNMSPPHAIER